MVDIQSAAAEIRRGKKDRRKKPQGKNIMSASATQGGHNNTINIHHYYTMSQRSPPSIFSQVGQKSASEKEQGAKKREGNGRGMGERVSAIGFH